MNVPFLELKTQYEAIRPEVEKKLLEVMASGAYIGGGYVSEFESSISKYLGVKHVVSCSSGTAALVLALRACGVQPGDEVITTPFTFFATAEAIASIGAIPVFVDVRQDDYNIDPDLIEEAVTEKTKAVLPVHIFGAPADMDRIMDIAKRHGLKVIEDDAQAIGSSYKGRKAGTLADIGCFSFYPTKNLGGCGDGGMVTTNDDDIAVILKALKEHGSGENGARAFEIMGGTKADISVDEQGSELYNPYKYYNYLIAYNSRLDAVQAAVLSIKLTHLDEYNQNRARIANRYNEGLPVQIKRPVYNKDTIPCWHQYAVRSEYKHELCSYLSEKGVGNGTFYPVPLHKQKAFNDTNSRCAGGSLPVAEEISSQSVCLPVFPEMTDEQTDYVIQVVNDFYREKQV